MMLLSAVSLGLKVGPTQSLTKTGVISSPSCFTEFLPLLLCLVSFFCLVPALFFAYFLFPFNSCSLPLICSFSLLLPTFCLFHHWALIGVLPSLYLYLLKVRSNSQAELELSWNMDDSCYDKNNAHMHLMFGG